MIRRLLFSLVIFSFLLMPATVFAYDSNICTSGSLCTKDEVGPLMKDISKECGNLGNCSLDDIMTVFINAGNYITGIIGAVVLLMYVIGGVYMLTSGGKSDNVQKGKKYLTVSTVGMLIVMFAYLGIISLKGAIRYGDFTINAGENGYYSCSADTIDKPCDLNSVCSADFKCISQCEKNKADQTSTTVSGNITLTTMWQCIDTNSYSKNTSDSSYTTGKCDTGLCPQGTNYLCCEVINKTATTD